MADGYARASRKLGVVFTTAGPGATNALTAVACAQKDNVPLLLITGNVATSTFGKGVCQDSSSCSINVTEIFRYATGLSELIVHPKNFQVQLERALHVAFSQPYQAAHLSIPIDVSTAKLGPTFIPTTNKYDRSNQSYVIATEAQIRAGFDAIRRARNPMALLGAGAALEDLETRHAFETCVNSLVIPVATSPKAKGVFPESHPLSLGVFGMGGSHRSQAYLSDIKPDVLLVIGNSLNEWGSDSSEQAA